MDAIVNDRPCWAKGWVTVEVEVFTNYGRKNEQRKSLTLRLKEAQETVRIGEIEF
jgi:hypothetical protein